MNKYYTKNAVSPVSRIEAIGAQRGSHETDQIPSSPNSSVPEQEVRRCVKCGTVLKDKRKYIICWINQDLHPLCMGCYRNVSSKKNI